MKNWIIIVGFLVVAYLLLRGGEERATSQIDYNTIAVSRGLSQEARELNLEKDLDVSLLPEMTKGIVREAAQSGLTEQAFLTYLMDNLSTQVQEISSIDLNGDDIVDPILIQPEPAESDQYVLLSIRVPAPDSYPLPKADDRDAWRDVETIEVATVTSTLDSQALTIEAQGNQHVYPNQQRYSAYDTTGSFLQMYFAMRMLDWMFMPSYYGGFYGGYGYGGYSPVGVAQRQSQYSNTVSQRGHVKSQASSTAMTTAKGTQPQSKYAKAYSSQPPQSLAKATPSRSFQNQRQNAGSGGFGRKSAASSSQPSNVSTSRSKSNRGGVWGTRSFSRGSLGRSAGGFRGFRGGFRRR